MIQIIDAQTVEDLKGILDLQAANLRHTKSLDIEKEQGFVTVRHDLNKLQMMNEVAHHIIAKDGDKVIAYALAMDKSFGNKIPELIAMFEMLENLCIIIILNISVQSMIV
jgi:hypothetical protein